MPLPERVLIDTSAFYALVSPTDEFYEAARRAYERLLDREQQLWTTSYVLSETYALVHRRLGLVALRPLVQTVQGFIQVVWIESGIHDEAWSRMEEAGGTGLGFVDWTTLVAAQQLSAHIFTFDQGFAQRGHPILPRPSR